MIKQLASRKQLIVAVYKILYRNLCKTFLFNKNYVIKKLIISRKFEYRLFAGYFLLPIYALIVLVKSLFGIVACMGFPAIVMADYV